MAEFSFREVGPDGDDTGGQRPLPAVTVRIWRQVPYTPNSQSE